MPAAAELPAAISRAERHIREWIVETPLQPSPIGPHLKLEHLQHTGSFKARGAFSRLLALSETARARGVIAASTGNHGAAVAYAAAKLGLAGGVVGPAKAHARPGSAIRALCGGA